METVSAAALWGTGGAILLLLLMSAFFSGSETALTASSRGKLHGQADKGARGAGIALKLREDSERLIGAILLGNNLVNILATSLATWFFTVTLGDGGVAVATLVMTVLVLVFSEVMPKTYAIANPERAAGAVAPVVAVVVRVLAPIVNVVRLIVRSALSLLGVQTDPSRDVLAAKEEIAGAIELGHSEGAVEKIDRDRLLGALDLKTRAVEEVMLHRSQIQMIDADADPEEIVSQCLRSPYTRIPVFRGEPENIVGLIHAKDLLRAVDKLTRGENAPGLKGFEVMDVAMKPYFIPETTTLDDQMREFLRRRAHFALVVDEYGSLRGLVTLEDILEEIVGEIADEHDVEETDGVERAKDGSVFVEGATTIRDLNRACDWNLPDDEANTVAGLVIHEAQSIPTVGQQFSFHGFRFEVLARERNRITKLRVKPLTGQR